MAPFRRVAAYVPPHAAALGLGMASALFRPRPGLTEFDFAVCARRRGPLNTDLGVPVLVEHGLEPLAGADLVLVLPGDDLAAPPAEPVLDALRAAHRRGATVAAHCMGVFTLAATGLLDGAEATTHWQYAGELAARHPGVAVRPEALYLDQGGVVTGAGAAAGMDMYLHLLRRDHGAALTNALARLLVTPPHRDGGQRQYITAPVPADGDGERLSEVIAWARANLDRSPPVDELAARALMSRRSFVRHFKAATGASPHAWLLAQRLSLAEELLETTDLTVERIAGRVGYRSAAVFREQFVLHRGVAPREYRRTFGRD
ncbi:helix-turn-helix domain-containing protein [Actinomadura sp. DC4]|uniref:GlxA family transcriptional regulator n=1 Tax=Actinomadura sp. DC4 TaxID=3055069 RepID=UPI0025AED1AA|nr:helix-turn-helix domain-containing protein [Actinomadura sp. DC4]MDN3355727.1 helix-turn-helix domain-containing protein [Actinomadura sp. DC4]